MATKRYQCDVVIVGGGLAGMVAALELLDANKNVLILDRDREEKFGGLAKESFGGIFFVNTPAQRRAGFTDSPDLALKDWLSYGELGEEDTWPRRWAEQYVNQCTDKVYSWLRAHSVSFFPVVHWVERGLHQPGNSVPRFHMVWGTGHGLIEAIKGHLQTHAHADQLNVQFRHHVSEITTEAGKVNGVRGVNETTQQPFEVHAEQVVIASGGICGSIERLKQHWYPDWGTPPETILNGSHRYADGDMHDVAASLNANITHLEKQWLYAAGIAHPNPGGLPDKGLSVVPPKSALWVNYKGKRIGPTPLVSGFDTRYLVEQICQQEQQYSWQIMNWKIVCKELAVSGSEFNDAMREKRIFGFIKTVLRGNEPLVRKLMATCEDIIVAPTLEALVEEMNALTGEEHVDLATLREDIMQYDAAIAQGEKNNNDEQVRRIAQLRQYRGDRARTCKFQKILDPKAMPLVAIREFILSRKSLGGIQTNLEGRVLTSPVDGKQDVIEGLYAVGEAAGFGGGGVHGLRALEGTFLGSCILTGRLAAQSIARG